jgi:hypothetical protein
MTCQLLFVQGILFQLQLLFEALFLISRYV